MIGIVFVFNWRSRSRKSSSGRRDDRHRRRRRTRSSSSSPSSRSRSRSRSRFGPASLSPAVSVIPTFPVYFLLVDIFLIVSLFFTCRFFYLIFCLYFCSLHSAGPAGTVVDETIKQKSRLNLLPTTISQPLSWNKHTVITVFVSPTFIFAFFNIRHHQAWVSHIHNYATNFALAEKA